SDAGSASPSTIRTISWSAAFRPLPRAKATRSGPRRPPRMLAGRRSNTTVTSPPDAANRSSFSTSAATAPSGFLHHPSGREPMTFIPSTSSLGGAERESVSGESLVPLPGQPEHAEPEHDGRDHRDLV